jgi:peroxiredoxin
MEPTLIGKKAPELDLRDVRGRSTKLYDIDADFTVVLFWSYDCTHCGETNEKLAKLVDNSRGKLNVYAVCTDSDQDQWKQKLNRSFENVMYSGNSKELYDIYSIPTIYLLDKNKVIQAKRLDVETLQKVLESKYKLTF